MKKVVGFFAALIVIGMLIQYWWVLLLLVGIVLLIIGIIRLHRSKSEKANQPSVLHLDELDNHTKANQDETSQNDLNQNHHDTIDDNDHSNIDIDSRISDSDLHSNDEVIDTPTDHDTISNSASSIFSTDYSAPVATRPAPTIHKLRRKLTDFVVFDIETTGLNRFEDEIIQISALKYQDDKLVDQFNSFVNPHRNLEQNIMYLTGITDADLESAPEPEDVIAEFTAFMNNLPLIGHNIIKFDLPFMIAKGFYLPDIDALDTVPLAQSKLPELKNHKLPTLKNHFGIVNRSHNALNDCTTNAIVYQRLRYNQLGEVKPDYSSIPKSIAGLRFCITGEFIEESRDDIIEEIKQHGGRYTRTVSGLTNYLLKGTQTASNLVDGVHSNSELKVMENAQRGKVTQVIGLSEFHTLINTENIEN
ncbi:hypothetical protein HFM82_14515 [Lactobacillus plantarum]|uniref:exonuclease domain-containing protein n=1 Tax=Lactiplantibacillus plantarum TaxID=1590 RepID=UPI00143DCAE1|nr:exonuclease domain-containing protein [Lactiplantibacillus plantarum]MBE1727431.1 hypothetical protein [Lactiplantibacillus plantarum]NKI39420.1 hypothetical protein [Lactiplantibacillus plantarum]